MEAWTLWGVLAVGLVAVELATGTVYLLMMAIGAAAGGLLAWSGASVMVQVLGGAAAGGLGTVLWSAVRRRGPTEPAPAANPNVQMDVGQTVIVEAWLHGRHTRAAYRGAQWDIEYEGADAPDAGPYIIAAVKGNGLVVRRP